MERISRERVERVARIYASNKDASQALGITLGSFGRLCRKFGIATPYVRRRRLHTARPGGGKMKYATTSNPQVDCRAAGIDSARKLNPRGCVPLAAFPPCGFFVLIRVAIMRIARPKYWQLLGVDFHHRPAPG